MQSVHISTNVVSSNPLRRGVLDTTLCDNVCQWLTAGQWFSLDTPVSSTNKTDRHDITEILLKMALHTITLTLTRDGWCYSIKQSYIICVTIDFNNFLYLTILL